MKKILLAIIAAAALATGCSSPLTAEQRAADKARRELVDSVANALASARLDSCTFLIPARSLQIGSGRVNSVTNEVTNFICARSGNAMFQLAPNHSIRSGANGLGGITLEGTLTLRKHSVDRRATASGNIRWAPRWACAASSWTCPRARHRRVSTCKEPSPPAPSPLPALSSPTTAPP